MNVWNLEITSVNVATLVSASPADPVARIVPVPGKEWKRIKAYLALTIGDIVALAISYLSVHYAYAKSFHPTHGVLILAVLTPIYIGIAGMSQAYTGEVLKDVRVGMIRSLQAFFLAASAVLLIAYFLKAGAEFSRIVFGVGSLGAAVLLVLNRLLLRRSILTMLGGTPYSSVVIADGVSYHPNEYDILLDSSVLGFDPNTRDPFGFDILAQAVANVDRVVIACPKERYGLWSSALKGMAIKGEIITDEHDEVGIIGVGTYGGRRTMIVAAGPLNLRDRIFKRALDIAASSLGILALAPLLTVVAIAIKMESRGPVLFVQNRIGRDNRLFRMYKFRSMFTDLCDENAVQLTTRNDSRVTRVGDFIRRTSIDELPQLINVLRGDMSIVGPRPHPLAAKAADLLYWDVDPRYRHRHSMKPGMTGLAQVRGFRGNTERAEDLTNRLQADLEYAANWSIWRDIRIIVQTFMVLRHQNAF